MSDRKNNKAGRPKGIQKEASLHIMISKEMKNEYQKCVNLIGSNISVKTCELISDFINKSKGGKLNENNVK